MVVAEGLALGEQLEGLFKPVDGLQLHDVPPEPVRPVEPPAQIEAVPEATAVGSALTVTETGALFGLVAGVLSVTVTL